MEFDMAHFTRGPRSHRDVRAEDDYCLYRLYDEEHDLLYVGATHNFRNRMSGHRTSAVWWQDVYEPYTLTEWYSTPREVAEAEAAAIQSEQPIWNRAGRTTKMIPYSRPVAVVSEAPAEPTEESVRERKSVEDSLRRTRFSHIEEQLLARGSREKEGGHR